MSTTSCFATSKPRFKSLSIMTTIDPTISVKKSLRPLMSTSDKTKPFYSNAKWSKKNTRNAALASQRACLTMIQSGKGADLSLN